MVKIVFDQKWNAIDNYIYVFNIFLLININQFRTQSAYILLKKKKKWIKFLFFVIII
jgi:hypothetical protein